MRRKPYLSNPECRSRKKSKRKRKTKGKEIGKRKTPWLLPAEIIFYLYFMIMQFAFAHRRKISGLFFRWLYNLSSSPIT